jgi:hypothetical protein
MFKVSLTNQQLGVIALGLSAGLLITAFVLMKD